MAVPSRAESARSRRPRQHNPWLSLWALIVGFFMIMIDMTIVSVANPAIKAALDPSTNNLDNVVWVTSAYLLAYAVPLLITGRLGDRFGPKNMYLIGLAAFTLASLGCGMSTSLLELTGFRAAQGLGAALMTPQTMAVVTRTFAADRRGFAMGVWGATAGVAMLVGPLAGGLIVDTWGWQWIFFVNLPIGLIGFALAWFLVPALPTHSHHFDWVGMLLSAAALFCIVFGLQEGERYAWGSLWGSFTVWELIVVGVGLFGLFVWQQATTANEPLLPMTLFRDRNFTVSNVGITITGFAVTAMALPLMFFMQLGLGLSPTEAALLTIPMAVLSGVLSPLASGLADRVDSRLLLVPGFTLYAAALIWYATLMQPETSIAVLLLPSALLGIGNSGIWGPLATMATRNLDPTLAGAGAGIYNTTRMIGSVVGSAAVAALMQARLEANLPTAGAHPGSIVSGALPAPVAQGFSTAMAQATLMPAAVMALGAVVALLMQRPDLRTRAAVGDRTSRPATLG